MHHVIIGNGVAGIEAAIVLRNRDTAARITLISSEHDHLFSRTALMYILCGQLSLRDTEPYDRELYERMRFERVRERVVSVDPATCSLTTESGRTIAYDRLLLAVGSRGRPAPWPGLADGQGVHHFVTLQDLHGLDAAAKPGMHVCVVGGGLIGVEVAEVLHLRGLHVHFLIREPWYFPVALDAREADVVAVHIRSHGVDVRTNATVDGLVRDADGVLTGVSVGGETLTCHLVVAAIGVVPNTDFLKGRTIPLSDAGGVETMDNLSVPGFPAIFAAGDCAEVAWIDGSRRPEQLWYTARDQGRVVAAAMLGDEVHYRRGTWYNSAKFFDLEYTTAGYIPFPARTGEPARTGFRTWYQQVPGESVTQRIVCRGERVVGFNCMGTRWNHEVFLRWIHERRDLAWVLERMEEARFDEEFMAPFRVWPGATLTEGA